MKDVGQTELSPSLGTDPAQERVRDALARCQLAKDGGAYTVILDDARARSPLSHGKPDGLLQNLTFAVKDMIAVRGLRQGGGCQAREGSAICGQDAPVVAAMRDAGAVIIGLTTLHELAFGVSGINHYTGTPRNPHDPARVPGGSSSGSAVAVATGSADVALGTDTGGSIRIPAALCGVVGYKPAYGSWPMAGILPLAPSLDHVGVLARSVEMAAAADALFAQSADGLPGVDGRLVPRTDRRLRLGVVRSHVSGSETQVSEAVSAVIDELATDYLLVDVDLPPDEEVLHLTSTVLLFEAAQVHRELACDPSSRIGHDVRDRLERGLLITEAEYSVARDRFPPIAKAVRATLEDVDVIIEPTVPICAPGFEDAPNLAAKLVGNTRLANLTGLPAISVPIPTGGLPVGLQLTAVRSRELFAAAGVIEDMVASGT